MTASFTNATTKAVANDLSVTEYLSRRIIDAAYSATVCRGLIRNESLAGQETDTAKFPAWPALTAASVAETADLSNTAINTTNVTISVGEVGIMATLTDAQTEDDFLAGVMPYAEQLGKAVADKQDADIAALFSSFSNATGSGASALTTDDFLDALAALDGRDAPGNRVAVLHTKQWFDLAKDVKANGGVIFEGGTPQDSRFGHQGPAAGTIFNVPVWQTTNVPTNTRDTVSVRDGAIFSSEALAFVAKREARVEMERDASARLTEIIVTSRYGTGELVDDYGQVLYGAA